MALACQSIEPKTGQNRGAEGDHYTFRQFGLSQPRTVPSGKVYLGRPEAWPTWKVGEVSLLFLYKQGRVTGFQTTVGLGYGKLGMGNGVVVNAFDNVGLFQNVPIDRNQLTADEKKMFDAKNGPVNADTFHSPPVSAKSSVIATVRPSSNSPVPSTCPASFLSERLV